MLGHARRLPFVETSLPMTAAELVLGIAPAFFGLVGTLVGGGLTVRAGRSDRLSKEDDEARSALVAVSAAVNRLAWLTKVGVSAPDDLSPGGIVDSLRAAVRDAQATLIIAGVTYRVASAALERRTIPSSGT